MMPDPGAAGADSVPQRRRRAGRSARRGALAAVTAMVGLLTLLVAAGPALAAAPGMAPVVAPAASGAARIASPGSVPNAAIGPLAHMEPARADADVQTLVSAALDQLSSSSVALLADSTSDASGLRAVVSDAAARGMTLWIVSIGTGAAPTEQQNTSIGDRVLADKHGTVIVLSADWVAVRSDSYTSEQLQAASDAAGAAGSDPSAARAAVDSLTAKAFPWGWVVVGALAAVLVLALAGGWWERRRRRIADAEELARLTQQLADRVGALAPDIVTLSDQVPLIGRPDVRDRFNQASADYNTLREALAAPLRSRRRVRAMDRTVTALEQTIADISSAASAAFGGAAAVSQDGPAVSQDGPAASQDGPATS